MTRPIAAGVVCESRRSIALPTLDQPPRLSALAGPLVQSFVDAPAAIEQDVGVVAIVLAGRGRAFWKEGD